MVNVNKTASRTCRFLSEEWHAELYKVFTAAFSDYVFPFALTEDQFVNHLQLNGVDLSRTVGCFEADALIGFSLNGFGDWKGKPTVYDAGTGVLLSHRRQGVSEAMFEMMIPIFKDQGIEQFLLEVITANDPAIRLYEKLGFERMRELSLMELEGELGSTPADDSITIVEIDNPNWEDLCVLWDKGGRPSWQNSIDAVTRIAHLRTIAGAFIDGRCVGYVAYSSKYGRIAQLAVDAAHRHQGIAHRLLEKVQADAVPGYALQVINIDTAIDGGVRFFENLGFKERLRQYEMLKEI